MAFLSAFIECSEPSKGTRILSNKAVHLSDWFVWQIDNEDSCKYSLCDIDHASIASKEPFRVSLKIVFSFEVKHSKYF